MASSLFSLYLIAGSSDCPQGELLRIVEEALASGVTCFQFREKGPKATSGQEKEQLAHQLKAICHRYQVPFIINDDVDLALVVAADGIHLGQGDLPVAQARRLFPDKLIGLSISSWEEYLAAPLEVVDYIGVGPVFPTQSKADASPVVGLDLIKRIRQSQPPVPVVAIGGIGSDRARAVYQAGADGLAVISALTGAAQVSKAVQAFLEASSC